MANNSNQVRLAPSGTISIAVSGTTLPTTATMALNAAFNAVGYVDENGVALTPKVALTDIMAWQSAVPVKEALDTVDLTLKFNMIQVNFVNWGLYFMNETFINNFGQGELQILSAPPSQEVALVLDWLDDTSDTTRLVVPRAVITDRGAMTLDRKKAQAADITIKCLDSSGTLAYLYTNNPDLTPHT